MIHTTKCKPKKTCNSIGLYVCLSWKRYFKEVMTFFGTPIKLMDYCISCGLGIIKRLVVDLLKFQYNM
jgi:hypothetical protein